MEAAQPATYGMPNEHEPAPWSDTAVAMASALREVANQLPALDALIAERETEVAALKDVRKRAASLLGEKPKRAGKTVAPREETVAEVGAWLTDHFQPEGDITTRLVMELMGPDNNLSRDTVRRALVALEERGTLRLERTAQGGGKVYRLS